MTKKTTADLAAEIAELRKDVADLTKLVQELLARPLGGTHIHLPPKQTTPVEPNVAPGYPVGPYAPAPYPGLPRIWCSSGTGQSGFVSSQEEADNVVAIRERAMRQHPSSG